MPSDAREEKKKRYSELRSVQLLLPARRWIDARARFLTGITDLHFFFLSFKRRICAGLRRRAESICSFVLVRKHCSQAGWHRVSPSRNWAQDVKNM